MKTILATLTIALLSSSAFAAPKGLAACDAQDLTSLNEAIADAKKDGYVNVKLMKSLKNETLGFYAWDKKAEGMHAEVCEYLETDEQVVANSWYYWEGAEYGASPAAWTKKGRYLIQQDEGSAELTMLKASKTGDVIVKIDITGTEEILSRSDIVKFVNL